MYWIVDHCSCEFTCDTHLDENGKTTYSNVKVGEGCDFHKNLEPEEALNTILNEFKQSSLVSAMLKELSETDPTLKATALETETGREIVITEMNRELVRSIYPEEEFPEREIIKKEYRPSFSRDTEGVFTVAFKDSDKKAELIAEANNRGIELKFI